MPKEWATPGRNRPHTLLKRQPEVRPKIWKDADASVTPHHLTEAVSVPHCSGFPPSMTCLTGLSRDVRYEHIANQGMIAEWAIHYKPG
jgi:hypothetical protein